MKANYPKNSGMGGGNMQAMLKQAQQMQQDMATLQEDLDARTYEVSAGGGMVTITISGKKEILSIDIKPDIVDPDDIETLTDVLTAAVNEAIHRVEQTNNEEMAKITGNLNLPGVGGMGLF